ncbi:MAG: glutamate synthase central domain-containing protein [Nitrososphaerota archaeon]
MRVYSKRLGMDDRTLSHLRQMSGVEGRMPGEPPIVSMGSTAPPFVEQPRAVLDHIVSDGAQVTRPSIDPYREPVETSVHIFGGAVRLSMPLGVSGLVDLSEGLVEEVVRTCYRMGVLADLFGLHYEPSSVEGRGDYVLTHAVRGTAAARNVQVVVLGDDDVDPQLVERIRAEGRRPVARVPSTGTADLYRAVASARFDAIVIDEDLEGDTEVDLELAVALCDRVLRDPSMGGGRLRYSVTLIATSSRLRGSGDVFKLLGLGAEVVLLKDSWKLGTNVSRDTRPSVLAERLENLLLGMQKELKLLAGAAGASSLHSTVCGNRELFRAVELDGRVLEALGVKAAGSW